MIEFISQLPTEYQEVEYIQSSGTQYIDTGVVATSGFEIDIKINIDTVTDPMAPILYAHEPSEPYKRNFIAYNSSKQMEIDAGDKITQTSVTLKGDDVIKASNVENNFYLNVNGTNYTPKVTTAASNLEYSGRTLHLLHGNGYDVGYTSGKVYYCKITVDGTLVRSFVPCYRKSDNVAGLYDLANNVFYTNAGSGVFAVGADSNKYVTVAVTPGGVIPIQYALRRRMMGAAIKKTWMVKITKSLSYGSFLQWKDDKSETKYTSIATFTVPDGSVAILSCGSLIPKVYLNGEVVASGDFLHPAVYDFVVHSDANIYYTGGNAGYLHVDTI